MSDQPLSLRWLCYLRDHGHDLKVSKEARVLASVLPTYGEGKKIFPSMVTLAEVTGMKRETVRNARRELEDKGLLEDITGDPKKQERTYRLSVPGYVSKVVPERTTPGPLEDHPLVPERTTPGPREDHNIKLEDQAGDQATTSTSRADGASPSAEGQDRGGQAPHTPQDDDPFEIDQEERAFFAMLFDMPLSSIRESFWTEFGRMHDAILIKAYDGCECRCESGCPHGEDYFRDNEHCPCICPVTGNNTVCECKCPHDRYFGAVQDAFIKVARDSSEKRNPVGYFQTVVTSQAEFALYRAQQADRAA